jgi:hypothetical protein
MNKSLLVVALLGAGAGCSFAARSPETYRDDTKAVLEKKNEDIRACYNGVLKASPTAQGKVAVTFDVQPETGKIANVKVDKAQTTAPDSLAECVTKSIDGVALNPPDQRLGQATWSYDFIIPPSAPGKS